MTYDCAARHSDSESGNYYLRARYYDPTTAQFITVDPAVAMTRSPYAYVAGNPLNGTDPSGMYRINPDAPSVWASSSWLMNNSQYPEWSPGTDFIAATPGWLWDNKLDIGLTLLPWGRICKWGGEAIGAAIRGLRAADTTIRAADLSGDVASNFGRFQKSLPSGAGQPTITKLSDGSYQFSADVPATNIPGSYATYTKVVGPDGVTSAYYKTTIAPDGSVVSVKVKYP